MAALTNEQHIKNPYTCPLCGSKDIEGGAFNTDDGLASQDMACNECYAVWRDYYSLTSYNDLYDEEDDPIDIEYDKKSRQLLH